MGIFIRRTKRNVLGKPYTNKNPRKKCKKKRVLDMCTEGFLKIFDQFLDTTINRHGKHGR